MSISLSPSAILGVSWSTFDYIVNLFLHPDQFRDAPRERQPLPAGDLGSVLPRLPLGAHALRGSVSISGTLRTPARRWLRLPSIVLLGRHHSGDTLHLLLIYEH